MIADLISEVNPASCEALTSLISEVTVNGLEEFLVGGQWMSRCADTGNLGVWLWDFLVDGQLNVTTPFPARASASRWESPLVNTRWAWCRSRSTVAVARVLGMIVSKPDGWILLVTATERRS
jgi:hypothetical protein